MDNLLLLMTAISIAVVVAVLISIRSAHIRVEYSVSWLGAGVTLLILSRWRWALDGLAWLMGVSSGPLALVVIVFCGFLIFFYRFSVILSGLKDANIAMAQKVAILEFQLRSLNEEFQAPGRS